MPSNYAVKKWFRKVWNIIYSSMLGFWEDDCYTKASTLTYYTVQSIIPFLAAILAIAKGFGFDEYLENLLTKTFYEQKEIFSYAIQFALSTLKVASSSEIVGIGILFLLWTNINLVGYIELTLNEIWKVKISRTFFQKIKDFSFALVVFPIIFVASGSATFYIESQIHNIPYFTDFNQMIVNDIKFMLPWFLSCILFGALYFLIPNARLQVWPRLVASLVAGTAFQLWQSIFINLQVHIFSYNIIYGAFALLPLFFIWLQFSWMIALLGAEISAHIENYNLHIIDPTSSGLSKIKQSELAFLILHDSILSFFDGSTPLSLASFSDKYKVSQEAVKNMISILEKHDILVAFSNKKGETCYHPLYDPCHVKVQAIFDAIDSETNKDIIVEESEALPQIRETLEAHHKLIQNSSTNVTLCTLFGFPKV